MTEIEALQVIIERLDLIYTLLLYGFSIGACVLIIYLLYRFFRCFF